jgi:hypothetical protein
MQDTPLQLAWPGVTEPDCYHCTWSLMDGVRQIKFINRACPQHGHLLR